MDFSQPGTFDEVVELKKVKKQWVQTIVNFALKSFNLISKVFHFGSILEQIILNFVSLGYKVQNSDLAHFLEVEKNFLGLSHIYL